MSVINPNPDVALAAILHHVPIHDRLHTSGQPTPEQFALIAQAGFEVVINLALTDASNAIASEDRRVLEQGMLYINLPILFDQPQPAQLLAVLDLLQQYAQQKVWLHCALNYRVSSVIYLHRVFNLGVPVSDARQQLEQMWMPDAVWEDVIGHLYLMR